MTEDRRPVVVEAALDAATGSGGAVWSLPHDGDLDANLVRLDPGATIAEHTNDEVDVLLVARQGGGTLTIDAIPHELTATSLVLVPIGRRRSLAAGPDGFAYLTVHRRRGPLTVSPST